VSVAFDDDLFDAQVIVERFGRARFNKFDLAELLGLAPNSVWKAVKRGRIPEAHHYEWVTEYYPEAVWTFDQVVEIVAARRKEKVA
jgi:hypothetical protein